MVIVKFKGGIGNQLFQLAFGLRVSSLLNDRLYFDLSFISKQSAIFENRPFKLMKLDYERTTNTIIEKFIEEIKANTAIVVRDNVNFDHKTGLESLTSVYLDGYFQSEDHFKGVENQMIECFGKLFQDYKKYNDNKVFQSIILDEFSVAVHVRRGDFVKNPKTLEAHGICKLSYYKKSIKFILDKFPAATFYFFSDDPEYCKRYFSNQSFSFVNVSEMPFEVKERDLFELYLMSKCRHFILANSTFSWWASWLARNENQVVIAPKKWFNNIDMQNEYKSIYNDLWLRF